MHSKFGIRVWPGISSVRPLEKNIAEMKIISADQVLGKCPLQNLPGLPGSRKSEKDTPSGRKKNIWHFPASRSATARGHYTANQIRASFCFNPPRRAGPALIERALGAGSWRYRSGRRSGVRVGGSGRWRCRSGSGHQMQPQSNLLVLAVMLGTITMK